MNKAEFRQHQDNWRQALISHKKESGRALEGTTIRVALALQHYEHAEDDGDQCCAYPTRWSLAVRLGLEGKPEHQRRTITKHLTALEQAGFIVKIREGIRPSYGYPKGQSAKWRLAIPVEDEKRLATMWDEPASPDEVVGKTEQATRSVDPEYSFSSPQEPVQFAHPTTPDYQPQTDQTLTASTYAQNEFEHRQSISNIDGFSDEEEKNRQMWQERYAASVSGTAVEDVPYFEAVELFEELMCGERRSNWESTFFYGVRAAAEDSYNPDVGTGADEFASELAFIGDYGSRELPTVEIDAAKAQLREKNKKVQASNQIFENQMKSAVESLMSQDEDRPF